MKRNLLALLISAFALVAFCSNGGEHLSHIKKIRHTTYPLDEAMTQWETRLDDQHIIHNFYDINGNKVLQRTRKYNAAKTTTYITYKYDEQNRLIEEIDGSTTYVYAYNADGLLEMREKYNSSGNLSEKITYEYTDGVLSKEITYGSSGNVSTTYVYIYENGLLVNREKYNSSDKKSGNIQYTYNDKNQLIEECDSTIGTSGSSNGKVRSALRHLYEYDEQNRLYSKTYQIASVTSYEITAWNEKEKYVYYYDGTTDKMIREEIYNWSGTREQYEIYEQDDYTYSSRYGTEFMPTNVSFTAGNEVTSIIMSLTEPANNTNLSGYKVIADNQLLDTLYTSTQFEIKGQVRGTHNYRVMAVYDTIAASVTSELKHIVNINLPAPTNASVISREYNTSRWAVAFSFTPAEVPDGVKLTGYRYKIIGGNGGAAGTVGTDVNEISFSLYPDTKNNENNLCKVELYAVYAEGESDAYTFDLDLRDTEYQITVKWQNERSQRVDVSGTMVGNNHYYYTSGNTGETLVANVEYDAENNPTQRYSTIDKIDYIETYDPQTLQWNKYIKKEKSKEDGSSWDNWWDCVTTSVYNAETNEYEPTEVEKVYSYYNSSWKIIVGNTSTYTISDGVETLTKYVTHYISDDKSLAADTIYAADKVSRVGLIEYNYNANNTLAYKVQYKYENDAFVAIERREYSYDENTGLISSECIYELEGDNKNIVETVTYYASKEYGAIKIPSNVVYADGLLTWEAPANKYMTPEGYRIFVNNIPYADVFEGTQIVIENIPSGNYTFTVMSLYSGTESNYAASVNGSFVNLVTFMPESVTPDVYNAELKNTVESLNEVIITFPAEVASLSEEMSITLNSEAGLVGNASAAISDDKLSVVIALPENLQNGMYFLEVPQGMIIAADGTYNPALSYTFVLQIPLTYDLPAPAITPESGALSSFDQFETFTLKFDRDVYALESVIGKTGVVELQEFGGNTIDAVINDNQSSDYTVWTITLTEKVENFGEYFLYIPEAIFGDATAAASVLDGAFISGTVNSGLSFRYIIENSISDCTITVSPVGGEDFSDAVEITSIIDDSTFSIKIDGAETVEVNPSFTDWNSDVLINLWDVDDSWYMGDKSVALYPVAKEGMTNEFSLIRFSESGIEWPLENAGNGYLVLNIPEGVFTIDGKISAATACVYKFTRTGIDVVDMDEQNLNVYSINGMLIKRNASWREVLNFEPGVYIVNGEKVYIR